MADRNNGPPQQSVKASYSSPTSTNTFEKSLASPAPTDVKSKVRYLSSLRSSTKQLQDDINTFLTAKMEEDKVQAPATNGTSSKKSKARDEEEEENYGEEKVEED